MSYATQIIDEALNYIDSLSDDELESLFVKVGLLEEKQVYKLTKHISYTNNKMVFPSHDGYFLTQWVFSYENITKENASFKSNAIQTEIKSYAEVISLNATQLKTHQQRLLTKSQNYNDLDIAA